jgi:hypothetical protein
MSWAAERKTTRTEDKAYCLLGLFDINMPLLYGEGRKSFFRLQEELLKCSSDQTLLAWGIGLPLQKLDPDKSWTVVVKGNDLDSTGMFARGPEDFRNSGNIRQSRLSHNGRNPLGSTPAVVHRGFRAEMPLMEIHQLTRMSKTQDSHPQIIQEIISSRNEKLSFAMALCSIGYDETHILGIPIFRHSMKNALPGYPVYGRWKPLVLIPRKAVQDLDAHTLIHVDSHWINDWCFNEPVFPTF